MKKSTCYNIIHSVKGGCGKTTFSLMLALNLAYCRNDTVTEKCKPVCLLDLDFLGSSFEYLMLGEPQGKGANSQQTKYFNQIIDNYSHSTAKNFVRTIQFPVDTNSSVEGPSETGTMDNNIPIDVSFASPDYMVRNKYRLSMETNFSQTLLTNINKNNWNKFLKDNCINKTMELPYRHVIIDMPPNSDVISDFVIEGLLNHQNGLRKNDEINYFLLQQLDSCHYRATCDWLIDLLNHVEYSLPDRIFIGFWTPLESADEFFGNAANFYSLQLKNKGISDEVIGKIKYIQIKYNSDYQKQTMDISGIANAKGITIEMITNPVQSMISKGKYIEKGEYIKTLINAMEEKVV